MELPCPQDSMQQWLDSALNSSDIRNRIAVTAGISQGAFGNLHLGVVEDPELQASNDDVCDDSQAA